MGHIVGSVMYLAQVSGYHMLYSVDQPARAMSIPSKAHMGAPSHLLRYHAAASISYQKGGFELTAFSDDNWGNKPVSGQPTSSYSMIMSNGPVSFNVGMQGLTDKSKDEGQARGSSTGDEGSGLLSRHDGGPGIQGNVKVHPDPHRQHFGSARGREQDLQLVFETFGF